MSKLSRTVLKEIVKECIIEIFEESFFSQGDLVFESNQSFSDNNVRKKKTKPRPAKRPRRHSVQRQTHLDSVSYKSNNQVNESTQRFDNKISKITSGLTNDPVMADIFKDTASTTLQQQISAGSRAGAPMTGGDAAAAKVSMSDPTELFAESAGKWATLAFSEGIKR